MSLFRQPEDFRKMLSCGFKRVSIDHEVKKRLRWYKEASGKGEGERKNEGVRYGWKLH